MKQSLNAVLQRAAALALVAGTGAALAHGDPGTHWHDDTAATLAGSLVAVLFTGAALRLGWLMLVTLRRRNGRKASTVRGQE